MIKNDRQNQLAAAQIRKLTQALAEVGSRERTPSEHPLRKDLELDTIASELEGLRSDVAEYEALRRGSLAVSPIRDLVELPAALIRKRIASGMTQKDLAERLGIAEQQIQRYEANDYASANLQRLREVARAVGLQLDLPGAGFELPRVGDVVQRLCEAGFERDFVLRRIASTAALAKKANDYARPAIDLLTRAGRMFAFSPDSLIGKGQIELPRLASMASFKTPQGAAGRKVRAFTAYAQFCSSLVLQTCDLRPAALPSKAEVMREQIAARSGVLEFASIVEYAWSHGVAVLPIVESGGFDAAVFREADGRAVVVLKHAAVNAARWMFDLLHELAHLVLDQRIELSIVDEASEISHDEDEALANGFASDVLLRGRGAELFEFVQRRANYHGPALKAATLEVARENAVPAENLAFDVAYRLWREQSFDWWAVAQGIARGSAVDPAAIALEALIERIHLDRLGDLDREILLQAIGE